MRLFIAEKPSLAQAIFEGLGGDVKTQKMNGYYKHGDDIVTYCYGHMLALCDPINYDAEKYQYWDLNNLPIKVFYPPKLKPIESSENQLNKILALIKDADSIVNAGDYDPEGCLLIDEIINYANYKKPVKRILVTDLNLEPVKKALANLQDNNDFQHLTNSALARSIGDQAYGYNLTQVYSLTARKQGFIGKLNIGRVQTAILGLVNKRTLENQSHKKAYFYELNATCEFSENVFNAKFKPNDKIDNINDKGALICEKRAAEIKKNATENKIFIVKSINNEKVKTPPPQPYNLSFLQIICAKKWGYTAAVTLETAQSLYENKVITYPRSDCRFLPDSIYLDAAEILNNIKESNKLLTEYCEKTDLNLKHKAFDTSKITAHHAICPTLKQCDLSLLNESETNIYNLIVSNFVALFFPDSVRKKSKIVLVNNDCEFVATQTVLTFAGWESQTKTVEITDNNFDISDLKKGDETTCKEISVSEKETTAPKYFVESSLLSAMTKAAKFIEDPRLRKILETKDIDNKAECGSIGTEATRAELLKKAMENTDLFSLEKVAGYKELVWKTTKQGQELASVLPKEIIMPDISAIWEEKMVLIRNGELTVKDFVDYIDDYLEKHVNHVKTHGIEITRNTIPCPKCGMGLIRGRSAKTKKYYWRCDGYPICTEIFPDAGGEPQLEKKLAIISEHKCGECGSGLIKKRAKGKFFWICSNSSECKKTYSDRANKPVFN